MRRLAPYLLFTVLVVESVLATGPRCGSAVTRPTPPCAHVPTTGCLLAISFVTTREGFGIYPLDEEMRRLAVVETDDGGSTWRRIGAVTIPNMGDGLKQNFVFADRRDGLLLGTAGDVLITHDGGAKWTPLRLKPRVVDVSTAAGTLWVATSTCPVSPVDTQPLDCSVGIQRSADGGRTWAPVSFPTLPYEDASVAAMGRDTVIVATAMPVPNAATSVLDEDVASGQLAFSSNGGTSWQTRPLPCLQGYDLSRGMLAIAPTSGTIWMTCVGQGSGGFDATVLYRSDNRGTTWTPESGCAIGAPTLLLPQDAPCGHLQQLVPLDSLRAFAADINGGLSETTDGGATWHRVAVTAGLNGYVPSLDFVNQNSGWIAFYFGDLSGTAVQAPLWHTSDGGRTWSPVVGTTR